MKDSRLGRWTNEVSHGKILTFFGLGSKSYGYKYIENGEKRTIGITQDIHDTSREFRHHDSSCP